MHRKISKQLTKLLPLVFTLAAGSISAFAADPASNGIALPEGYKDWRVLSVHHRSDNNTLRAVLGNDVAITAAREGKTNPWPNGAILGKMVWKGGVFTHPVKLP